MILFLHNRYRTTGGEERAVEEMMWLVREHLGEDAELLARDSAAVGRGKAAAGLLTGGLAPEDVASAVRRTGARIVHAHNLHPAFGWRALAAARGEGARVVMHLHQYRLVCAVGTCFTDGADCTRCHGANTIPGLLRNCRGSRSEALVYAAGLALWQRRLAGSVDAFVVPSRFALQRLRELRAPIRGAHVVPHAIKSIAERPAARNGGYALIAGRLDAAKGIQVAIEACRRLEMPLVVAGEGPYLAELRRQAGADSRGSSVTFTGNVAADELDRVRDDAAVALVPSLSAETFGLSAAEAMARGLPVAGSRIGALQELLPDAWLAAPGDAGALAQTIARLREDDQAGTQAIERIRALAAPEVVAPALAAVYESVSA